VQTATPLVFNLPKLLLYAVHQDQRNRGYQDKEFEREKDEGDCKYRYDRSDKDK
jgi:hypothetical protein